MKHQRGLAMNASKVNPVRLTIPLSGYNLSEALGLGISFKDQAIKAGGAGRVYRETDAVRVDLDGLSAGLIQESINAFAQSVIRANGNFNIAVSSRTSGLPISLSPGEHLREKLTKNLLSRLPVGAWLVSNSCSWSVQLKTRTDRPRVWENAVEQGAAQRTISVVWNEADAETISAQGQ
jgi:hypothetical protein